MAELREPIYLEEKLKEIQGTGFKTLAEAQRVEFEVTQGQKGPQASKIRALT